MSDHGSNATHLSGAQLEALAAGEPRARFEAHLAACSACREELEALARENQWFRSELAHAAERRSAARLEAPRASNWGLYGIAAAVALAATLSFVALLNARAEPEGETVLALPAEQVELEAPAVFALGGEGEGAEAVKPPAPPTPEPVAPVPEPAQLPQGTDRRDKIEYLLGKAKEALVRNNWAAAADLLKSAEQLEPNRPEVKALRAEADERIAAAQANRRGPATYEGRTAAEWFKELQGQPESGEARAALSKLGSETLAVVAPALNEGDGATRKLAEEMLATLELREADLPRAAELLGHPHFGIRRTTVRLLGKLAPKSPEAMRLLRGALDDRDRAVSEAAEEALAGSLNADRERFQAMTARYEAAMQAQRWSEATSIAYLMVELSERSGDAKLRAQAAKCLAASAAQVAPATAPAAAPTPVPNPRREVGEASVDDGPVVPASPPTPAPNPRREVGEASVDDAPTARAGKEAAAKQLRHAQEAMAQGGDSLPIAVALCKKIMNEYQDAATAMRAQSLLLQAETALKKHHELKDITDRLKKMAEPFVKAGDHESAIKVIRNDKQYCERAHELNELKAYLEQLENIGQARKSTPAPNPRREVGEVGFGESKSR
ncbi:MAG: HEAT repeat domain-containing protein [Planctomycetes bacterium]|nr:HEAT repeat domain-containing protein [Planctomycetota bacterium]